MSLIKWNTTKKECDVIEKIALRVVGIMSADYSSKKDAIEGIEMDITACHLNGNPLRLDDMLEADNFNLMHDVSGIGRHIDRNTGKLLGGFSPRFSLKESSK